MPPLQSSHGGIFISAAPSASLDRTKEWEGCCVHAMGFEWVDQFGEQSYDHSQSQQQQSQQSQQPIFQIISLIDEKDFQDDDFILDDDSRNDGKAKTSHQTSSDAWMENALRIQADLNRMADWIQSKQQDYVGLDMKDGEASLIQSTVTTFAATTASELETLREMISKSGAAAAMNSNLANHRSGIVQILLEQLQQRITTPFGILQKQRTRIAVQLWQNPLQCKLYQPSLRRRRPSNNQQLDAMFGDDNEEGLSNQKEQRFLPRHPYYMGDETKFDFISKYAHKPSTRIPPEPPAFLTRLAKRQKRSSSSIDSSQADDQGSLDLKKGIAASLPSFQKQQQKPSFIPPSVPMDYQQQLEEDLHNETMQLDTQLIASNDLDSVQQMETRMVEITSLIGHFSKLVEDQQEQVIQVQESARETKENMEKGQENLVDATERTKQSKHYKAWLIFGMAMTLLFFHTLRN